LRHVVERAVLLSAGGEITPAALSLDPRTRAKAAMGSEAAGASTLEETEKSMIEQALARTGGNVSRAARDLGTTRMALRYRIKKYGLQGGRGS
jgi:DNA-binding NtrC family response regulator